MRSILPRRITERLAMRSHSSPMGYRAISQMAVAAIIMLSGWTAVA